MYRVILQGSIIVGNIVGPYITNSHGIVVVSAEGYVQNSGYEYASIEVPIWLTPDTYKLRTKSGTSRVWCIINKYVKNWFYYVDSSSTLKLADEVPWLLPFKLITI